MTVEDIKKHIEIIEQMMFGQFNHTVNGKRTFPALQASKEALEKQIPKKVVHKNPICFARTTDGQEFNVYEYYCPLCDTKLRSAIDHHCPCGQALDWSDTE